VVWDHCRPCNETCNYLEVAEQAVDITDFEMFKHVRENVLIFIDEHQSREKRDICRHDPLPDEAMAGGYDEHGGSILEDTIRLSQDDSDLDDDNPDEETSMKTLRPNLSEELERYEKKGTQRCRCCGRYGIGNGVTTGEPHVSFLLLSRSWITHPL